MSLGPHDDAARNAAGTMATRRSENPGRCCERCCRQLEQRAGYRFGLADGRSTLRCLGCALRYRTVLRRAILTSLVVGTVLTAINQGDLLLHGPLTAAFLWKLPLTYLVPFAVSTYSAIAISRTGR